MALAMAPKMTARLKTIRMMAMPSYCGSLMVATLVAVRKFRVGRLGLFTHIGRPRLRRRWVVVLFEHCRQFVTKNEGDDPEEDASYYLKRN